MTASDSITTAERNFTQASETIDRIVTDYLAECTMLLANAKPADGLFGLRRSPVRRQMSQTFYRLGKKIADTATAPVSAEEASDVILTLLTAPEKQACPDMARQSLMAAQRLPAVDPAVAG